MRLLGSLCETCNMYIQEVSGIQLHLQEYSDSDDYVLSSMAGKMMSKYNKYWGDLDKVNVLLFIAVILDPRTKLGSLEYWFKDVLSVHQCTDMMIKLKNHLQKLYDHFDTGESSSRDEHSSAFAQGSSMAEETENRSYHLMNRFHKYLNSKSDVQSKSELDQYLMEEVEKPNVNFDILNW
ncbi:zinc finger BED domain-containing protein RICESLEEPER 1-like [Alnus glutinosa]|uniref:zinc finger BED domain-containing protein RICESLEEPER 1-like n=1 Tax=Alnus glutinosa TaxID=3517 RepID=UPI002D767689|nr:zinc finger BED domain-containing protein RICESLEEPER 1-like [Alnus glutinosa]